VELNVESITPKKAKEYLESNRNAQRHVKSVWVKQLARMMENGEYDGLNGETLKFAKNGKGWVLVDGQHRLNAVTEYGKPVKMLVIRGVDDNGFKTLDQGYSRTVENFYQIENQSYAKVCSQVAKWLCYAENGGHPLLWKGRHEDRPLPGLIAEWALNNYPDLPDVLERVGDFLNQFQKKGLGTKNHLAYCYYMWQVDDPIDAYEMTRYLATGDGDVCSTVRALREYLLAESRKDAIKAIPGTIRGSKIINAMNHCWNLIHRDGKKNLKSFKRQVASFDKGLENKRPGGSVPVPESCL